jgi:uncharacterized protein
MKGTSQMQFSRHNILGRLAGSDGSFIVNPLARSADILDPETARDLERAGATSGTQRAAYRNEADLAEKGYLVEPAEEARRYRAAYLDFLDRRDAGEVQLFFVPWYACNFACPYCYQGEYADHSEKLTPEVMDAFFDYVGTEFAGRRSYVTLFGGEPLLPGQHARRHIEGFLAGASRRGLRVAVVTNGYTLADYLDLLETASIREIQVTLDGVGAAHDGRRPLKGGGPTYGRVVEGIDAALRRGLPVNLRVVLDRENLDSLPEIAGVARERGWTGNPKFKTQLGRNYELHTCQAKSGRLFSRVELYQRIYAMAAEHPEILDFHRPAFSLARFLWENGELPEPLFDACPGCKTEWAFDFTGRIYSCTAMVGKAGEELGTFYPNLTRKDAAVDEWQARDVTTIPGCRDCAVQLACGGGCAAVAKNREGRLHAPDCRPVRELLGLGMSMYFGKGDA